MNDAIEQFCSYLDSERNVSPHTLSAYRSDLSQFAAFLAGQKRQGGPEQVDHLTIRQYLALLHKGHAKSSIGRKLSAIRALFRFLLREGRLEKNPAELVGTPKKEKRVPFHLNIDQVTTLVSAPAGKAGLPLRD